MSKKRKRHSPEQIVAKLPSANAALNSWQELAVVFRSMEINHAIYRRWYNAFSGIKSKAGMRLKEFDFENASLQRMLAEVELDKAISRNGRRLPSKMAVFWRLARREKRLDLGGATRNATPQAPCTELHRRYKSPGELARSAFFQGKAGILSGGQGIRTTLENRRESSGFPKTCDKSDAGTRRSGGRLAGHHRGF